MKICGVSYLGIISSSHRTLCQQFPSGLQKLENHLKCGGRRGRRQSEAKGNGADCANIGFLSQVNFFFLNRT